MKPSTSTAMGAVAAYRASKKCVTCTLVSLMFLFVFTSEAQLAGTGDSWIPVGCVLKDRSNGYQVTYWCGNNPESWIRGSVFLDQWSGLLTMHIQLETDATHAGPKGQVLAYLYDQYGNYITRVASQEVSRGGKPPGRAAFTNKQSVFNLGPDVGRRTAQIRVYIVPTGTEFRIFDIMLDTLRDFIMFFA